MTRPVSTATVLLGGALVAWLVLLETMRGMDGGLPFVAVWVTMTAAMMLPSAAPVVLLYDRVRGGFATWVFVGGYLLAWTAVGLAGFALLRVATDAAPVLARSHVVAGAALVAAGVYQLTPLKRACLRHCRAPLHLVTHGWRGGRAGALRMGAEHGLLCVGCCWGLMLALLVLGLMSLAWMAAIATVIFVEKATPVGRWATLPVAAGLVALGVAMVV